MRVRPVERSDTEQLLALHLRSWRETYRGLMPDAFLDGTVLPQRLRTWYVRMALPREDRLLAVAEHREQMAGFICVHALADRDFGSRIESVHVLSERQRSGAGTLLMRYGAEWLQGGVAAAHAGVYLWVMQRNLRARAFYERLGGIEVSRRERADPSGGSVPHCRYAWRTPADLLRGCERSAERHAERNAERAVPLTTDAEAARSQGVSGAPVTPGPGPVVGRL